MRVKRALPSTSMVRLKSCVRGCAVPIQLCSLWCLQSGHHTCHAPMSGSQGHHVRCCQHGEGTSALSRSEALQRNGPGNFTNQPTKSKMSRWAAPDARAIMYLGIRDQKPGGKLVLDVKCRRFQSTGLWPFVVNTFGTCGNEAHALVSMFTEHSDAVTKKEVRQVRYVVA